MKKSVLFLLTVFCLTIAQAQNTSPCPGLKNPANFTSGSTAGPHVGFYSGQTGTKIEQLPDPLTGATGMNMTSAIIPASQLANTTDNGSISFCSSSLDPNKRFRIMSNTEGPGTGTKVGKDPLVNYNLPYTPTDLDSTIIKSIRLGNCGTNANAEGLFYTMNVTPSNAMLTMYYAIVVQAPGHGPTGDPTFVIRVTRETSYGSGTWQQISDTLFYMVSSYGATNGIDGWHNYNGPGGNGLYRDWNKLTIDLSNYLYEQIRVEIYISDCAWNGHYGYCYLAGDCQAITQINSGPHNLTSFDTPAGANGYWTARVGDRIQGNGGSTPSNVLSTCSRPNKPPIVGHANITDTIYYSGYCQHRCGSCNQCTLFDGHDQRFRIYTNEDAGLDQFTINSLGQGLPRIPEGHTSSIRLGDMRATGQCVYNSNSDGNNKGSEALFYTMKVTPQNAIVNLSYAVVACRFDHSPQ